MPKNPFDSCNSEDLEFHESCSLEGNLFKSNETKAKLLAIYEKDCFNKKSCKINIEQFRSGFS